MTVHLRPADPTDAAFLERMLAVADSWRSSALPDRAPEAHTDVWHYVEDWPRDGDFGVIAVDETLGPVGATWARFFPPERPGYGFIDVSTPELAIGIEPTHQGRGLGRRLLSALIDQARNRGLAAISLNVETENHRARRLYAAAGFAFVEEVDASITMRFALN